MLFVVCTRMSVRRAQADFAKLLTDAPDRLLFSAAADISTVRNVITELETTLFDGSSSQMVARVQKYLVGVSTACAADAPPAECDADAVAIEELLSADIISQYAGILDHPELERLASLKTSLLNHVQMWLPGAKAIFTTTTDASDADIAVFYGGVLSQPTHTSALATTIVAVGRNHRALVTSLINSWLSLTHLPRRGLVQRRGASTVFVQSVSPTSRTTRSLYWLMHPTA